MVIPESTNRYKTQFRVFLSVLDGTIMIDVARRGGVFFV